MKTTKSKDDDQEEAALFCILDGPDSEISDFDVNDLPKDENEEDDDDDDDDEDEDDFQK